MTRIESKERLINHSNEKIFTFLSDFRNFENLMPSKVTNYTATEESCYFSISGIASLGMRIVEREPHTRLKMLSDGKVPFDFDFNVNITESDQASKVSLVFNAKLNAMLKMVAVKPLGDFLEQLLDELEKLEL
jgi:carbon monoxide dehydrogenase subunit G